jgi:septal ring factor EnvC (AmiA/AmiB activator)
MLAVTETEIRAERKQLQREVSLWRSEVRSLQQEYRKALADLRRLEAALGQREQALEAYARALDAHEERLARAEWREPAEDEGGPAEGPSAQAPVGSEEILKHWRWREDHERVKRQHHVALGHWTLLLQTVSDPREGPEPLPGPRAPVRFRE